MSVGVVNRMYFQTTHHHNSNGIISSDVKSRWKMMLQVLHNFICGFSHVVHFDKVFSYCYWGKNIFMLKKIKINKTTQKRNSLTPFICIFPLLLACVLVIHYLLFFFFTHLILCLGQMIDFHKVQGFLSSVQTSFGVIVPNLLSGGNDWFCCEKIGCK